MRKRVPSVGHPGMECQYAALSVVVVLTEIGGEAERGGPTGTGTLGAGQGYFEGTAIFHRLRPAVLQVDQRFSVKQLDRSRGTQYFTLHACRRRTGCLR